MFSPRRSPFLLAFLTFLLALALLPTPLTAQTYTDLHNFNCTFEGCQPGNPALLAQARDGNLYGTTTVGGI